MKIQEKSDVTGLNIKVDNASGKYACSPVKSMIKLTTK